MKTCRGCGEHKAIEFFYCFPSRDKRPEGLCKKCMADRKNNTRDKAKAAAYSKAYLTRNPDVSGHNNLMRKFTQRGLTLDRYHSMAERQDFLCDMCHEEPRPRKSSKRVFFDNFVIDHNHSTGKVRGLICVDCNAALGMLRDSSLIAMKAADYLRKHGS